jgi:CRISPR-associated endonuclease Csy4
MKYYLDITLLPDAEANLGFLWQKVYQQVHLALVENKIAENESAIGISFPKYKESDFPLGDKLRLFSETQEQFKQLELKKWFNRLTDYTHCTSIKEVPKSINQFACFQRKQFDTNIARLARRRAKRKGESFEQSLKYLDGFVDKETKLPFINVKSLSGKSQFRMFIKQEMMDREQSVFNCYGLSSQSKPATVPWF